MTDIKWKDSNKIILYHGGTDIIKKEEISIEESKKSSDFGKGFYTTNSKQAKN